MVDWGTGTYERTARDLEPIADVVAAEAAIRAGERVLDLGAGTGNGALRAARAGAVVTAADPARRLLEVARERAGAEGLEIETVAAAAENLPFDDASFDVVLSIFAIIFTSDPRRAAAELLRVLAPGGRALLTTWVPEGGIHTAFGALGRAMGALAPDPPPPPFGWGEPDRVRALFEPLGATVVLDEHATTFTLPSAEEFLAEAEEHHPMTIAARGALGAAGRYNAVRAEAKAALEAHSESTDELVLTSRYLLVTVRR